MSPLFIYLLKSALSLFIFYLSYALVQKREVFFSFNRMFLVIALFVSVLLPFFNFNIFNWLSPDVQIPAINLASYQINSFQLDEIVISAINDNAKIYSFFNPIAILYFLGAGIQLIRFISKLFHLDRVTRHLPSKKSNGIEFIITKHKTQVFSFFNKIFINEESLNSPDVEKVIDHEKVHILQYHSIDLILAEMICIFQWFNPFAYLLKKAIKENHEFIADEQVLLKHNDRYAYSALLYDYSSIIKTNSLTHNFSYSLLKRRLVMMNKPKKPIRLLLGMMGAIIAFSLVLFACSQPDDRLDSTDVNNLETTNDSVFTVVEVMPQFPGGMDSLFAYLASNISYPAKAKNEGIEGKVIVNFIIEESGSVGEVKIVKGIGYGCDKEATRVVSSMPDWTPGMQSGKKVKVSFKLPINFNLDAISTNDSVFKVVDKMPEFPGGNQALMTYLGSNIKYPETAKRDSIQGRVFVQFIVEKDGRVSGTKVLRGIGGGCDEEALRVVSSMPAWYPGLDENGKAVRVQYNIPIKYTLD